MSTVSCWISLRRTKRLTTTWMASAPATPSDSQATTCRRAARRAGTSAVTSWRVQVGGLHRRRLGGGDRRAHVDHHQVVERAQLGDDPPHRLGGDELGVADLVGGQQQVQAAGVRDHRVGDGPGGQVLADLGQVGDGDPVADVQIAGHVAALHVQVDQADPHLRVRPGRVPGQVGGDRPWCRPRPSRRRPRSPGHPRLCAVAAGSGCRPGRSGRSGSTRAGWLSRWSRSSRPNGWVSTPRAPAFRAASKVSAVCSVVTTSTASAGLRRVRSRTMLQHRAGPELVMDEGDRRPVGQDRRHHLLGRVGHEGDLDLGVALVQPRAQLLGDHLVGDRDHCSVHRRPLRDSLAAELAGVERLASPCCGPGPRPAADRRGAPPPRTSWRR